MVAYIQQLLKEIIQELDFWSFKDHGTRFEVLTEELNRLDPRDFSPDQRYAFMELRRKVRQLDKLYQIDEDHWDRQVGMREAARNKMNSVAPKVPDLQDQSTTDKENEKWAYERQNAQDLYFKIYTEQQEAVQLCQQLITVLGTYGGRGSALNTKSFPFISDPDLRQIVERDYRSLIIELIPSAAWKSAVVMAGSILEAILYDQLTRAPGGSPQRWQAPRLQERGVAR